MNPSEPDDRLSAALRAWPVEPPRDPNFRPAVFQALRRRARVTWSAYVRSHLVGWSAAALAAVVVAGWTGRAFAEAKVANDRERMVISYLGELDPRVMARLRQ